MSDQFNRRDKARRNGYVSFVQGIKTKEQTQSSVLPKIRVSYTN